MPDDPIPWAVAFVVGPALILGGALIARLALLGRQGRLARNRFVGIRTPRTLSSDAAWERAHRAAAPWLVAAAAGAIAPGLILLFRPANRLGPPIILVGLAILVAFTMAGSIVAHLAADDDTPV